MVCAPVWSIIPSLKLGHYLSVQAHKSIIIIIIYHIFLEKKANLLIRSGAGYWASHTRTDPV